MTDPRREPVEALLDLVFYAPIGAFFHGPDVVSELAERGRSQVANAKVLGGVALERGRHEWGQVADTVQQHVGDLLVAAARAAGAPMAGADDAPDKDAPDEASQEGEGPSPAETGSSAHHFDKADDTDDAETDTADSDNDAAASADGPGLRVVPPVAVPASELPIPDYDNLSASQVVPRLDDLAGDELEAVRDYETAHRGRMTILSRIAQLQAS